MTVNSIGSPELDVIITGIDQDWFPGWQNSAEQSVRCRARPSRGQAGRATGSRGCQRIVKMALRRSLQLLPRLVSGQASHYAPVSGLMTCLPSLHEEEQDRKRTTPMSQAVAQWRGALHLHQAGLPSARTDGPVRQCSRVLCVGIYLHFTRHSCPAGSSVRPTCWRTLHGHTRPLILSSQHMAAYPIPHAFAPDAFRNTCGGLYAPCFPTLA